MPTAVCGKETPQVPPENPPADAKGVAKEPLPPQKVLKIFSINIIAQGLPFCRRRVSTAPCRAVAFPPAFPRRSGQMSKVILQTRGKFDWRALWGLVMAGGPSRAGCHVDSAVFTE
ncbi:hypothetical protein D4764_06G0003260 [Takifugu flavidus]|uniref:Uncharacterized protein n=1 Tax=Takifugu flavidus TaxID=433684 RepID=A0A5C6MUP7_9TELE|nr:hypothetical protein D4764_06G0003260 [Takifugu flavidus]